MDSNTGLLIPHCDPKTVCFYVHHIHTHTHRHTHTHTNNTKCSGAVEKERWTPNKDKSWIVSLDFFKVQFLDCKFWPFWENKLQIAMGKTPVLR